MGALKPWHLATCGICVLAVVAVVVLIVVLVKRRGSSSAPK
ncbi:hypothetical protein ABZS66_19260 [Dactylosporangium sp. NPDC005572]